MPVLPEESQDLHEFVHELQGDLSDRLETYFLPHLRKLRRSNGAFPYNDGMENVEMTATAAIVLRRWFGPDDYDVKLAGEYLLQAQHEGRARLNPWLNYQSDPKTAAIWVKAANYLYDDCPEVLEEIKFIESTIHNGKPAIPGRYAMQEALPAAMELVSVLPTDSPKLEEVKNFVFSQQRDGYFSLSFANAARTVFAKMSQGKLTDALGYGYWQFSGGQRLELTAKFVNSFCEGKPFYWADSDLDAERVRKGAEKPMIKAGEYLRQNKFPLQFAARLPFVALDNVRAFLTLNSLKNIRQNDYDAIFKALEKPATTPSGIIKTAYSSLWLDLFLVMADQGEDW